MVRLDFDPAAMPVLGSPESEGFHGELDFDLLTMLSLALQEVSGFLVS